MEHIKVLLIEDNPGDARLIQEMLAESDKVRIDLEWKERLSTGLKRIAEGGIDVILLDLMLPDSRGFDALIRMQAQAQGIPIVVLTGLSDVALAIKAVRRGAQDYLIKGQVDSRQLARSILYAIARRLGEEKQFTVLKIKEFNGKEGRPAYIAFKGKVYDVSNSSLWKDGVHLGSHFAGEDLTESIVRAPHAEEVLRKYHIIGELSQEEPFRQRFMKRIKNRLTPG